MSPRLERGRGTIQRLPIPAASPSPRKRPCRRGAGSRGPAAAPQPASAEESKPGAENRERGGFRDRGGGPRPLTFQLYENDSSKLNFPDLWWDRVGIKNNVRIGPAMRIGQILPCLWDF
jgi:hypothetical protein